ncbi:MAG: right-handed parallel beta-helix repeat-containing protein [Candidatus Hodarchaeales archaeon]
MMRVMTVFVCFSVCLIIIGLTPAQEPLSANSTLTRDFSIPLPTDAVPPLTSQGMLQEWSVNSQETRENETIIVNKLAIGRNGSLTLINCILVINSTEDMRGDIDVYGALTISNQTIIRAVNTSIGYTMVFYSTSTFIGSDSTIRDVGKDSWAPSEQGVFLNGKQSILRNVTIVDGWMGLMIPTENPVKIRECSIISNQMVGIWIYSEHFQRPGGANVVLENSIVAQNSMGVLIRDSNTGNNTIRNNTVTSNTKLDLEIYAGGTRWLEFYGFGIGIIRSANNRIIGNRVANQSLGIVIESADGNNISQNEITADEGSSLILSGGSSGNLVHQNTIYSSPIGVEMNASSANTLTENQIRDTQEAAISIEASKQGNTVSSNELASSSGVALKISESSWVNVTNNTIAISSENDPAVYLIEADNCSFLANTITVKGPVFSLLDSSMNLLSENNAVSASTTFLLANSQSKNIMLTVFDRVNASTLNYGSTLKLRPKAAVASNIDSMALHVNERLLSSTNQPALELLLDTQEIGGGEYVVAVHVLFLNGTQVNWTFSLSIQGRPLVTSASSDTSWPMLISLSVVGLLAIKSWRIKRCRRRARKYSIF